MTNGESFHKNITLVFDIGGTSIRAGIFDNDTKQLLQRNETRTPNHHIYPSFTQEEILQDLIKEICSLGNNLLGSIVPVRVVAGFPGPVQANSVVLSLPTVVGLPLVAPFPARDLLKPIWPLSEVEVLNDVTAAGYWYADKGYRDFCVLSCGSGVGIKVFLSGHPVIGSSSRGGEVGHLVVDHAQNALLCDCGERGHIGSIASGRGVLNLAVSRAKEIAGGYSTSVLAQKVATGNVSTEDLVQAFLDNDKWTVRLFHDAAQPLGTLMATIYLSIGIEKYFLIGGFALAAGERFRSLIVQSAKKMVWDIGQNWDGMVDLGIADDNHGLAGAGLYALRRL